MLRVFIGYDSREVAAYQVCAYSIIKHATQPVSITPLNIRHLTGFTNTDYKASTEFAFSRFLVPYLCDYRDRALFMDCDMLVRTDISKLFEMGDDNDVMCVKHKYEPSTEEKFLGAVQTSYRKKNWSSVMLFNNPQGERLSKHFVNTQPGLALHQFEWTSKVGELGTNWNHLVGEYPKYADADIVHFTLGGPYFEKYRHCEYADEWWQYWSEANSVLDVKTLESKDVR